MVGKVFVAILAAFVTTIMSMLRNGSGGVKENFENYFDSFLISIPIIFIILLIVTKPRSQEHKKSTSVLNTMIWATLLTLALVCLGIVIFGKDQAFAFSVIFFPALIIFFGFSYAAFSSIFKKK